MQRKLVDKLLNFEQSCWHGNVGIIDRKILMMGKNSPFYAQRLLTLLGQVSPEVVLSICLRVAGIGVWLGVLVFFFQSFFNITSFRVTQTVPYQLFLLVIRSWSFPSTISFKMTSCIVSSRSMHCWLKAPTQCWELNFYPTQRWSSVTLPKGLPLHAVQWFPSQWLLWCWLPCWRKALHRPDSDACGTSSAS